MSQTWRRSNEGFEAFNKGNPQVFLDMYDPDIVLRIESGIPTGAFLGAEAVEQWFDDFYTASGQFAALLPLARSDTDKQSRRPGFASSGCMQACQAAYASAAESSIPVHQASSAHMSRRRIPPLAVITRPVSMSNVRNQLPAVSQAPCGISPRALLKKTVP
jgi:hypothetical protein